MRWNFRASLCVLSIMTTVALVAPSPVAASGGGMGCWPNRADDGQNYHDWSGDTSGLAGGMSANIFVYSPWVQPNRTATTAWVMIQTYNNPYVYAQVGWREGAYGARDTFSQIGFWNQWANRYEFTDHPMNNGGLPIGGTYNYTVNYNPYSSQYPFTYWANNQQVGSDGWDIPDGQLNEGLVSGETWSLSSQMPGGYAGPSETFTSARYWWPRGSGGSWKNFNPTQGGTPYWTNRANYNGGTSVAINDKACPH